MPVIVPNEMDAATANYVISQVGRVLDAEVAYRNQEHRMGLDQKLEKAKDDTIAYWLKRQRHITAPPDNPFIGTENTRLILSAIDRLKAKALAAKNVAPDAIKRFEADLDSILAEKAEIESKRIAAVSPHQEAIAGVKGELDGLRSAIDILSND